MLTISELDSIEARSWRITCPNIRLSRHGRKLPRSISGSGEILQTERAEFVLRAVLTVRSVSPLELWIEKTSYPAGEVLPEAGYWNLEATDLAGRHWKATRVLIDFSLSGVGRTVLAKSTLPQISHEQELSGSLSKESLVLYSFQTYRFPRNTVTRRVTVRGGKRVQWSGSRDSWRFKVLRIQFQLSEESKSRTVLSLGGQTLSSRLRDRALEALHFATGAPFEWEVEESLLGSPKRSGTTLRSPTSTPSMVRHQPPLPNHEFSYPAESNRLTTLHHRKIVERYLRHTLEYDGKRHPLWGLLKAVFDASSAAFIDIHALTLCVACEALLGYEFRDQGSPSHRARKEARRVRCYLRNFDGPTSIKTRVDDLLGMLSQTRAIDRLWALEKAGLVEKQHIGSWRWLRNASVHSLQGVSSDPSELRRHYWQVQVLFNHLIFAAIAYRGPYLDYATRGWPLRFYPPGSSRT